MSLTVTHPTAADGTFSAAGATAWNESHAVSGTVDFSTEVANKPTTLSGYGITDAQPLDTQLTSLAGLAYTGNSLKAVRVSAAETGFELVTLTSSDVGLGNVTNNAQTQAAVVPNTAPSAGQILVGNAGGTAYAPATMGTDATLSSAGALTIANNAVTYAKMQDVSATNRFIGRITAGAGDPEELTGTQATTLLDAFTSALKGLAPASGGGTSNFLRADGTWAAPGGVTKISGNTGAFVADTTWETLTANSSDVTTTTQTTVMTLTGVDTGTYRFKGLLVFQTAATATGIGITANHTGTVSRFVYNWYHVTTGGTAATGISDQSTATAAGQLVEGKAERVKDTRSSFTVGVDTLNADELAQIEGIFIVTATGSFEIKIATEVAASAVRLMAGSTLELHKIA